jgi:hypothetical protein
MELFGNVYFAPDVKYNQVYWDDPELLFQQYEKRIYGYFLDPANKMIGMWDSFSSTLIIVCAIDGIIRLRKEMKRPELEKTEYGKRKKNNKRDICDVGSNDWKEYLNLFKNIDNDSIELFYNQIRCGLVHEGRLKNASIIEAFDNGKNAAVNYEGNLVVSPKSLMNEAKKLLLKLHKDIKNKETGDQFIQAVNRLFSKDREYFNTGSENRANVEGESPVLVI